MPSPTFARSLVDRFRLGPTTRLTDVLLTRILAAIDARFVPLEALQPEVAAVVDNLKRVALTRVSEVLVPIFEEAQQIGADLEAIRAAWSGTVADDIIASVLATVAAEYAAQADVVHLAGAETIAGTKRFLEAARFDAGVQLPESDGGPVTWAIGTGADGWMFFGNGGFVRVAVAPDGTLFPAGIVMNGVSLTAPTEPGKAVLQAATADAQRTALGLRIGQDIQAYSALLAALAGLALAGNSSKLLAVKADGSGLEFVSGAGVQAIGDLNTTILAATTTQAAGATINLGTIVAGSTLVRNAREPSVQFAYYETSSLSAGFTDDGNSGTAIRAIDISFVASLNLVGSWRAESFGVRGQGSSYLSLIQWRRIA